MKKLERVYHPYDSWEEMKYGMWDDCDNRPALLEKAISFTGNYKLYGLWMNKVISDWPTSCENALTDQWLNKKAWVGHAAVAYALQIPEDVTRQAWGYLSDEQQSLANNEAERAIRKWEYNYRKNKRIYKNMGEQMLFKWDT